MNDDWIKKALKKLSSGKDPDLTMAASGSPSIKLPNRHNNIKSVRVWYCIECHGTFELELPCEEDKECPHCHFMNPIILLTKLAGYEIDKKRENS